MKLSRNSKMFAIGVVLLLAIFLSAGKLTNLFAVVPGQVSDGFFLYGDSPTVLTNLSTQTASYGGSCPFTINTGSSSYWDTQDIKGTVMGGDTELKLSHSAGTTCGMGWAAATSSKGFAGRDFKADINVDVTSGGCAASGTLTVQLVDNKIPQNPCSSGICPFPSDGVTLLQQTSAQYCNNIKQNAFSGLFELHRNVFSNSTDVLWQGQKIKTINTTGQERVRFIATANLGNPYQGGSVIEATITNARSRPIFSCELRQGDMLAMESFSGGQSSEINISSLRFPVKSFCLAHPAILTDSAQSGSTSTAEPYNLLINGQNVPITQTQTLTLFYVFDNSAGLVPTQCSISQAYNAVNSTCTDPTGIVQVCSQGIQDPQTGLCVVQPSITCANGTYNSQTNKCEIVPPSGVSCSSYGSDYVYNTQTGVCERTPTSVTSCTDGRLDLETGICVFNPPVTKICTSGTYNNVTDKCELKIDASCPTGLTYDAASQSCKGQPTSAVTTTQTQQAQNQTQQGTSATTTTYTSSQAYNTSYTWFSPLTMLIMLLVLSALLYLIFFTGMNGRRRWEKFKDWLWRNKEGILVGLFISNVILFIQYYGIFFIPVLGKLLELLRQSYPIAVVWFTAVALTMLAGAIVDQLIEPKK